MITALLSAIFGGVFILLGKSLNSVIVTVCGALMCLVSAIMFFV